LVKRFFLFFKKIKIKKKLRANSESRHLQVQALIDGGPEVKPNSVRCKGILGIAESWRCRSRIIGVQTATPLTH